MCVFVIVFVLCVLCWCWFGLFCVSSWLFCVRCLNCFGVPWFVLLSVLFCLCEQRWCLFLFVLSVFFVMLLVGSSGRVCLFVPVPLSVLKTVVCCFRVGCVVCFGLLVRWCRRCSCFTLRCSLLCLLLLCVWASVIVCARLYIYVECVVFVLVELSVVLGVLVDWC